MAETCAEQKKKNLGRTKCVGMPELPSSFIETPVDFGFEDGDEAELANWQTAVLADDTIRIYKWPKAVKLDNVSQEAAYEDTPQGIIDILDGNYRFRFFFREGWCTHKKMVSHRNTECRVFIIDVKGQIWGTIDADGRFVGYLVQLLHTEKFVISDGSSTSSKSPVLLALSDNLEIDERGEMFKASFIEQIYRIVDVELAIVSAADDEIVVDVVASCDSTPLLGLLAADFSLLKADGTAQSALTSVASTTVKGRYTLSGAAADWVTGTLGLRASSLLTPKAYEAPDRVVVTIV